jgi:hypothetical protein
MRYIVIKLKLTIIIRKTVDIIFKLNLFYSPNKISSFSDEIKLIKFFELLLLTVVNICTTVCLDWNHKFFGL